MFLDAFWWFSLRFIADLVGKDSCVATLDQIDNRLLAIIILFTGFVPFSWSSSFDPESVSLVLVRGLFRGCAPFSLIVIVFQCYWP